MKFILIVMFFNTTSQNSSSITMQEFNNQQACLAAKAEIANARLSVGNLSSQQNLRLVCVPKE